VQVPANRLPFARDADCVRTAEAIVLVFPIWNFGPPPILKGYLAGVSLPGDIFSPDARARFARAAPCSQTGGDHDLRIDRVEGLADGRWATQIGVPGVAGADPPAQTLPISGAACHHPIDTGQPRRLADPGPPVAATTLKAIA